MNALDFEFVGEYGQPGLLLPDKKLGFVPLAFAQELLRMEGRATEIAVALHHFEDAEKVKPVLQATLGPEYEVSTWHDVAAYIDDAIATQNFILNLIAGVFLFVALLGIANTMLMSVLERTREIGTMMSVGVRRRQILTLFLLVIGVPVLGASGERWLHSLYPWTRCRRRRAGCAVAVGACKPDAPGRSALCGVT